MKVRDVIPILDAKIIVRGNLGLELKTACGSDIRQPIFVHKTIIF